MKIISLIFIIPLILCSCASPGVKFKDCGDSIEITTTETNMGIFGFLFGSGLKGGKYECAFEGKSASFDSKADLRIIDMQMLGK